MKKTTNEMPETFSIFERVQKCEKEFAKHSHLPYTQTNSLASLVRLSRFSAGTNKFENHLKFNYYVKFFMNAINIITENLNV